MNKILLKTLSLGLYVKLAEPVGSIYHINAAFILVRSGMSTYTAPTPFFCKHVTQESSQALQILNPFAATLRRL